MHTALGVREAGTHNLIDIINMPTAYNAQLCLLSFSSNSLGMKESACCLTASELRSASRDSH